MTTRLTGIFAHPDDDAYLIGGTLLLNAGRIDLSVIFATSGEAGPISDPSLATRDTLGSVREGEQRAYLEVIGYQDADVEFLRHPDYYLPDVPMEQLVGELEILLRKFRPHIVVTFGPDGLTSHHDHIHVGAAATEAFKRMRAGVDDDSFQRLYYVGLPRSDVDRFYEGVRSDGYGYGEEGRLFDVTGVPDESIAVRVDTRPVVERKLAGMLVHKTQLIEFERVPKPLRWIYLDSEDFVQAYPPLDHPDGIRRDLLDGPASRTVPPPATSGQPPGA
jgi:LmbE family N-acetylglucosaminyl deacetylase